MRTLLLLLSIWIPTRCALAEPCWDDASRRFGIDARLLRAVADVESSRNPRAVNRSHFHETGTVDIGLMQINSSRLASLARYGIHEQDLYDPCTSIAVGAWTLSDLFARYGVTWNAVGAYNAACTKLKGEDCRRARSAFAWRVYRKLMLPETPGSLSITVRPTSPRATTAAPVILAVRVSP
jgi:soluble lytic murein transglycosylase-like protein